MNIISNHAEEGNVLLAANAEKLNKPVCSKQQRLSDFGIGSLSPANELKATISFRALVESDGQKIVRKGQQYACCCTFHQDSTPSFFISREDDHAYCFGCDRHWSIFDYVMERTGCDFVTALKFLSSTPTLQGTKTKESASVAPKIAADFIYSEQDLKDIKRYTSRVSNEPWLAERIASTEQWKTETIAGLATEGHLGWAGDALAFIYKTGYKLRKWPGRAFWWEVGHPHLWRFEKISNVNEVWITEGETDAIELIDKGAEQSGRIAVVATASASSFKDSFVPFFNGKHVTVLFDGDEAGRKGAAKVHALLAPVAASLRDFNPMEGSK